MDSTPLQMTDHIVEHYIHTFQYQIPGTQQFTHTLYDTSTPHSVRQQALQTIDSSMDRRVARGEHF